ncbi:MAG: hypothetical protein ABIL09_29730, partial [Gemmatimonadota bacterium]
GQMDQSRRQLDRLIAQTEASGAGIFVDTMVSPSFVTALAQTIQMPGVSGLENNSVLFEFSEDHLDEVEEVVKGCQMAGSLGFNICVLRSTEHHFGYRRALHVWLTRYDDANSPLLILLAYIIMGHPDWREAEITIFATFPSAELDTEVRQLQETIATGRLPISARSLVQLPVDDDTSFNELVAAHSRDADLVLMGYSPQLMERKGAELFARHPELGDILFVNANQEIAIS